MKPYVILIFILILSCKKSFEGDKFHSLTNNKSKFWYIDSKNIDPTNEWITLWYFTDDNDYFRYLYNSKSKELKILDNGDNIDKNIFSFVGEDSISLNQSKFPILKLTKNEFILKNIYSNSFFPKDSIVLKSGSNDNKKINENCDSIIQKIVSLNKKFY